MASNDMNSWDEDPDELLRRRWQQTFADFEVQPRASVSRHVLNALTKKHRHRLVRRLALTGVFLMLMTGVVYQLRLTEPAQPGHGLSTTASPARRPRPHRADGIRLQTVPGESSGSINHARTFPAPDPLITRHPHPAGTQHSTPTAERLSPQGYSPGHTAPAPRHRAHFYQTGEAVSTSIRLPHRKQDSFVSTHLPNQPSGRFAPGVDGDGSSPAGRSINAGANSSASPPAQTDSSRPDGRSPINWNSLSSLAFSYSPTSFGLASYRAPVLPGVPIPHSTLQPTPNRPSLRHQWFVEAVPLSSFQWMSTPQASSAYLSRVSAPAAFSPATWGYQLNGGIRFRHWQAYLTMGQLRRWAYYTISENRYRIDPGGSNPGQLVRETHSVAENVSLPMAGIGISQYRHFSRDRYVVNIGGQLSYLPTSQQSLTGLRAGLARQIQLRSHLVAQVGIHVDYGLNRFLNEQQQLVIRPLMMGFGIRIQPK